MTNGKTYLPIQARRRPVRILRRSQKVDESEEEPKVVHPTSSDRAKGKTATPEAIDLMSTSPSESEQETQAPLGNKAILMKAELEAAIDLLAPVNFTAMEKISPQNNSTNIHIVHLHDTIGRRWRVRMRIRERLLFGG